MATHVYHGRRPNPPPASRKSLKYRTLSVPPYLAYVISGPQRFVVLEDRSKRGGDAGKFLLYRWQELALLKPPALYAATPAAVEITAWTYFKLFYR